MHPLGLVLLFGIVAVFLWPLYHFFATGRWVFEIALGMLAIIILNICGVLIVVGIPLGIFKLVDHVRSRWARKR
jgi:hypothetical protein